ncbi:MAG: histidine phosphatase family protein [Ruminococcaceae bacterium]|nr:histidine phosphatase family protein [Oscillospiraceae bacterium]
MRNRTENQITLALIRHGETPSNALGRYLGQTEEDLSDTGKERLLQNRQSGKYPQADVVFSSPMERCLQTAGLLYGCTNPIVVEEWREMDFGRFEGKNYRELNGNAEYQAWIDSSGELPFPSGESRQDFLARCRRGLGQAVGELGKAESLPASAAAVVHGGTVMALLSTFCGGDYFDYQCKNGEGYLCRLSFSGADCFSLEWIRKL